jgi:hypothetical protein
VENLSLFKQQELIAGWLTSKKSIRTMTVGANPFFSFPLIFFFPLVTLS